MSEALSEFNSLLGKKFTQMGNVQTAWVVASDIDWQNKVMDAVGVVDDLEYFDVLLGLGAESKRPVKGAKCIIGIIGNAPGNTFLIYADQLEQVEIHAGETTLEMSKSGFVLKQGSESFKSVLNDLIDEINKIVVIQGRSVNVPAVTAIKTRLNKILS